MRIGPVDFTGTGKIQLDANPLCGYLHMGNNDRTAFFECAPSLHGRYMTVQKLAVDWFETHELYFCELLHLILRPIVKVKSLYLLPQDKCGMPPPGSTVGGVLELKAEGDARFVISLSAMVVVSMCE